MADELKRQRGTKKAVVTRFIGSIDRFIAEKKIPKVQEYYDKLMNAFENFADQHEKYHEMIENEDEVEASDKYFLEFQKEYIAALARAQEFVDGTKDKKPEPDMTPAVPGMLSPSDVLHLVNLPKVQLEVYDGDPLQYNNFMTTFEEHVGSSSVDERMKLTRLIQYTSGKAKEAIRSCALISGSEGYKKAKEILQKRFGDQHIITDAIIRSIRNGRPVKTASDLQVLSDELTNCLATLCSMKRLSEVDTQTSIIDISNRLQPYLRNRWRRKALEVKRETESYPGFKDFVEFIYLESEEANDPVYGQSSSTKSANPTSATKSSFSKSTSSCFSSNVNKPSSYRKSPPPCVACKQEHRLFHCQQFKSMRLQERIKFVKDNKICENCLLTNHLVKDCRNQMTCGVPGCGAKHSKFLHLNHGGNTGVNGNEIRSDANVTEVVNADSSLSESQVRVPVVSVKVNDTLETNVLLDNASTNTFCTRQLVNQLGLKGSIVSYSLSTLSESNVDKTTEVVDLDLKSEGERLQLRNVFIVETIPVRVPHIDVSHYPHLSDLSFVNENVKVDILIGQDHSEALLPLQIRKGGKGEPFAVRSLLGWSINGPVSANAQVSKKAICHFVSINDIEDKVNKLWSIENDNVSNEKQGWSVTDNEVIKLWDESVTIVDGHYQLPIPWKSNVKVPNNMMVAMSRLKSLKTSLAKRGLTDRYKLEIAKLCSKGYAEKIPNHEIVKSGGVWYLPHQGVTSDKKPDKLRVVFDCASKFCGQSINDKCKQGPDLCNKLFHVLLRFRCHCHAVTSDVEAMYYQVKVPPHERDFLRFLWFNDEGGVEHYRMTCHVFGGVWCSSAASYALRRPLVDFDGYDPLVRDAILNCFYVDDCLISMQDELEANSLIHGVKDLLSKGGFKLTKFVSNNRNVLDGICEADLAEEVKDLQPQSESKALGLKWNIVDDVVYFDICVEPSESVTRRVILSIVSSMFDPLGLISPVLVIGRILFQKATRLKLSWDQLVTPDLGKLWSAWLQSLRDLSLVKVPRCVKPAAFDECHLELHHFSDASTLAYGSCSYLRCINKIGEIHVSLLCSKSRVCPLKDTTIPRLELQAAVLSARMDAVLRDELHLDVSRSWFWVDSTAVLKYIINESKRFHVFVANRVSEIRGLTSPDQWRHIPGEQNPADLITRGSSVQELFSREWFHGPSFLSSYKSEWEIASDAPIPDLPNDDPEVKVEKSALCCFTVNVEEQEHPIEVITRYFGSWVKVKRAVAWLLRCKDMLSKRHVYSDKFLSVTEIDRAELVIIKHVQSSAYGSDIGELDGDKQLPKSSQLRGLSPYIDNKGIVCVGGRICHAQVSLRKKHPYIIPYNHPIAKLIARDVHNVAHLGIEWCLSLLRSRFWVTRARYVLKSVKSECVTCRKLYDSPCVQRMADLPEERLLPGNAPFSYVGIDCMGPFAVKLGRSEVKRYACVFTCFNSRALHVEKLDSMDTNSFLNGFRRFVSRRGLPIKVWSDNGSNFIGGQNELLKGIRELERDKIYSYCAKNNVEWVFNPPGASHMGGIWERVIRTIRRVLAALLGNARLNDEILQTLLCEVESIINSRPITKVPSDPQDPQALTPNHLLLLREGPPPPPGLFKSQDIYCKRWRHVQYLAEQFWKRWVNEYLPTLQVRHKWLHPQVNLKCGDVVLVSDENTPRGLWPLAVVTNVKTSKDGLVRTVQVRTKSTSLVRPISKIVLLEGS